MFFNCVFSINLTLCKGSEYFLNLLMHFFNLFNLQFLFGEKLDKNYTENALFCPFSLLKSTKMLYFAT